MKVAPIGVVSMCVLAGALSGLSSARAQVINKCRIDGQLVLQSAPCPIEAGRDAHVVLVTAAVTPGVPGAPHKRTLAEILRARDGGDPPPARIIQSDGAGVLRARMGAV